MKRLTPIFLFLTTVQTAWAKDRFLGETDTADLFFILPLLVAGFAFIFFAKTRYLQPPKKQLGFWSITPHKRQRFFPVDETIEHMEPVVNALAEPDTNVYSNLSKITLTHKPQGVYLEEKNYKISILINRRRSRRTYLNDGDILDMGELTLMFTSTEPPKYEDKPQTTGHLIPRMRRAQGRPIKAYPSLIPADSRKKTYYLTKNLNFIGRSDTCDLVSKAKSIAPRHSKIEKVAGRYKISDLGTTGGTFVNGRRVDQKFLKDGDNIAFESVKYTFSLSGRPR
ncbi:MAG: FHA domain-containing protein [bacterium]|nr:FHA domain-containing protein [bacterium]